LFALGFQLFRLGGYWYLFQNIALSFLFKLSIAERRAIRLIILRQRFLNEIERLPDISGRLTAFQIRAALGRFS